MGSPPIISLDDVGKKQIGWRSNVAVKVFEIEDLVAGTLDSRCIKVGDGTLAVFVDLLGDHAHAITAGGTMEPPTTTLFQRQAPKHGGSMFCTTRDTIIGEPGEDVSATEGSLTMDITCTVGGSSAGTAASAGASPAGHGLGGCKLTGSAGYEELLPNAWPDQGHRRQLQKAAQQLWR